MKNSRPAGAYGTVQPTNLAFERDRFLAEAAEYEAGRTQRLPVDPVFTYADMDGCEEACPAVMCTCARGKLWQEYGEPDDALLPHALEVLHRARQIGVPALSGIMASVEDDAMTEEETEEAVKRYLDMHGIRDVVDIEWLDKNKCSVPSMRTRCDPTSARAVTGRLHLVRGAPLRRQRLQSLLDHEVGTHFLRAYNQNVRGSLPANRPDFGGGRKPSPLEELESEEGLATINTHISSASKVCCWVPPSACSACCRGLSIPAENRGWKRACVPSAHISLLLSR